MRLKFLFYGKEEVVNNHPFIMKSGYTPSLANTAIENYIFATKIELGRIHIKNFKDNLTKAERMALQSLKQKKDIVIKKADKNSSTVLLEKDKYIEQALNQLNDGIHYEQIANSHTTDICQLIENKVRELHAQSYIDDITLNYLLNTDKKPQVGRLYLLPKIHKIETDTRKEIRTNKELLQTVQIPGRPIISLCNSPIEKIGKYIDYFLQPVVRLQWTYTQDTTSFINKIEKIKAPRNVLLATFDITSMYTNLHHCEILEAVYRAWPRIESNNYAIPLPPRKQFLELLKITLENNEFEFNGLIYKQIVGVVMGAHMSPSLADLRMFEIITEILGKFRHTQKIIHLSIYRDDGFFLFDGDENTLADFF